MTDTTYHTDVDRHVCSLESQLAEDNLDPDSDVLKTFGQLQHTLKEDGFSLAPQESAALPKTTVVTTDSSPEYVVRAFRVGNAVDASVVAGVFTEIDGWKTRTLELKGRTFVVVTNAPRWSKKRIKVAMAALINGNV